MLGAIAGDIIGSVYEHRSVTDWYFPLFTAESRYTDDTLLTLAVAETLLGNGDYREAYQRYFARDPLAGFGSGFALWASERSERPYGSFGNGAAMRVSPVAWARQSLAEVLAEAERSAILTHNHPEGIRGARAVAGAVYLARIGSTRERLCGFLQDECGYRLDRSLAEIRPGYTFDVTCQGSVPEALTAFLEAGSFVAAVRNAVWLGGDADTMGAIAGALAEAWFGGVPHALRLEIWSRLPEPFIALAERFCIRYGVPIL